MPEVYLIPPVSPAVAQNKLWDWLVVRPKSCVNYVVNPSFEYNNIITATGWTLFNPTVGSSPFIDTTQSYRGLAALRLQGGAVMPSNVVASQTVTVSNSSDWAIASCWVYLTATETTPIGLLAKIGVGHGPGPVLADPTIVGRWQRVWIPLPNLGISNSTCNISAYCFNSGSSPTNGDIYWDAFQVEDGSLQLEDILAPGLDVSTYFDGDADGCRWLGRPHLAASLRPGSCRSGGVEISLGNYLRYKDMTGWGMPPVTTVVQPFGLQGGEVFQRSLKAARVATITGMITAPSGEGIEYLHRTQADLLKLLAMDVSQPQKPVGLIYDSGYPAAQELATEGVCEAGLEFATLTGLTLDPVALRFHSPEPYMRERQETAATIAAPTALAGGNLIYRPTLDNEPPTWQVAPGAVNGVYVSEWVMGQPGVAAQTKATLWCGGDFTALGATATTGLAVFDPSTGNLSALGGSPKMGVTGSPTYYTNCILDICQPGPNSPYVYIAGSFAAFYDSTGASHAWPYLVRVNLATLAVTAPPFTPPGTAAALSYDPGSDLLYVGGWTTLGLGQGWLYEIGAPSSLTPGFSATTQWGGPPGGVGSGGVYDMTTAPDGSLYVNCESYVFQGQSSAAAWRQIGLYSGAPAGTTGHAMAFGPDGQLYLGGTFTTMTPGGAFDGLAKWNGGAWSAVGARGASSGSTITSLNFDSGGRLHIGGCINCSDSHHLPGGAMIVEATNYSFGYAVCENQSLHVEQAVPISSYTTSQLANCARVSVCPWDDSVVLLANAPANIAAVCAVVADTPTPVQYSGTAAGPCVLSLTAGAANVELGGFRNERTHGALYFNNLVIYAGETFSIDTTPGAVRVWSDLRPDLSAFLSSCSNVTDFQLLPGTNYLSYMAVLQTPAALLPGSSCLPPSASVRFFARHKGIDGSASGIDEPSYLAQ